MSPARVLGPADGAAGFLGSIGVRFLIDGGESGGGFSLVEHPMSAHARPLSGAVPGSILAGRRPP